MQFHYFVYSAAAYGAMHLGFGWWSLLIAIAAVLLSFVVEGAFVGIRDGLRYRRSVR